MISATKCVSWGERYASEDSRLDLSSSYLLMATDNEHHRFITMTRLILLVYNARLYNKHEPFSIFDVLNGTLYEIFCI